MSTGKAFWLINSCESTFDELTIKTAATAMPTRARRTVALCFMFCLSFADTPCISFNFVNAPGKRDKPKLCFRAALDNSFFLTEEPLESFHCYFELSFRALQ